MFQNKLNNADKYYIRVFSIMFRITPIVATVAALCFTVMKIYGYLEDVEIWKIVLFDIICMGYFVLGNYLAAKGITKNGEIDQGLLKRGKVILIICLLVQWNLITYVFPGQELWGTAAFYVLLSAVLLNSKVVLQTIIGLSASIGISWLLKGDLLLPAHDEFFTINLTLIIIALTISFTFTYIIVLSAERLLNLAEKNAVEIMDRNEKLELMSRDIIDFTADLIEQRDSTSGTHVKRVRDYTKILAYEVSEEYPEYGLTEQKIDEIAQASVLHDVGKIMISDQILLKPGKLTTEEFDEIKNHTVYGEMIIDKLPESVEKSFRKYGKEIAVGHHEKYDGKGYPKGLSGDEIPISSQIVSIADCFDALTTDRPYKKAFSPETALEMIRDGQCGIFSDKLMHCLENCEKKFIVVCNRHSNS